MNTQETIAYYQGLTKRQLFKAYRDAITHLNECNVQYNTGHDYLHGEPIVRYQRAAQTEVYLIEQVLNEIYPKSGYGVVPAVPAKIARFTIDQRRDFIRAKELQHAKYVSEQAIQESVRKEAPLLDAMEKVVQFIFSYNSGFIGEVFEGHLVDHFQRKFDGLYVTGQPLVGVTKFIQYLDAENKRKLFSYILNK